MRVLLDESVPLHLGPRLSGHQVSTVQRESWSGLKNGALLKRAAERFDAFITGDQSLQYQQNHATLQIGVIVLAARDNRVETIVGLSDRILEALRELRPGQVVRVAADS